MTGPLKVVTVTRTHDEWIALFAGSDACVTPALSLDESLDNAHLRARLLRRARRRTPTRADTAVLRDAVAGARRHAGRVALLHEWQTGAPAADA